MIQSSGTPEVIFTRADERRLEELKHRNKITRDNKPTDTTELKRRQSYTPNITSCAASESDVDGRPSEQPNTTYIGLGDNFGNRQFILSSRSQSPRRTTATARVFSVSSVAMQTHISDGANNNNNNNMTMDEGGILPVPLSQREREELAVLEEKYNKFIELGLRNLQSMAPGNNNRQSRKPLVFVNQLVQRLRSGFTSKKSSVVREEELGELSLYSSSISREIIVLLGISLLSVILLLWSFTPSPFLSSIPLKLPNTSMISNEKRSQVDSKLPINNDEAYEEMISFIPQELSNFWTLGLILNIAFSFVLVIWLVRIRYKKVQLKIFSIVLCGFAVTYFILSIHYLPILSNILRQRHSSWFSAILTAMHFGTRGVDYQLDSVILHCIIICILAPVCGVGILVIQRRVGS